MRIRILLQFEETKIIISCEDGSITFNDLIQRAKVKYRKLIKDEEIVIENLTLLPSDSLLDMTDQIGDYLNDLDEVKVYFRRKTFPNMQTISETKSDNLTEEVQNLPESSCDPISESSKSKDPVNLDLANIQTEFLDNPYIKEEEVSLLEFEETSRPLNIRNAKSTSLLPVQCPIVDKGTHENNMDLVFPLGTQLSSFTNLSHSLNWTERERNVNSQETKHLGEYFSYPNSISLDANSANQLCDSLNTVQTTFSMKRRIIQKKHYPCQYCGKRFICKGHCKIHERIHTGEKPYSCRFCDRKFNQKGSLKTHERIHTGEKPFRCRYCEKGFYDRSAFHGHERIHTGEKPYSCRFCDRKFKQNGSLKIHERIHTGEKPFRCRYCEKSFYDQSAFRIHERIHTGDQPYACQFCYKRFNRKEYAQRHEETHRGEPSSFYPCPLSDARFSRMGTLQELSRINSGENKESEMQLEKCFANDSEVSFLN